ASRDRAAASFMASSLGSMTRSRRRAASATCLARMRSAALRSVVRVDFSLRRPAWLNQDAIHGPPSVRLNSVPCPLLLRFAIGLPRLSLAPDDDFQTQEDRQLFQAVETQAGLAFHQLRELSLVDPRGLVDGVARFPARLDRLPHRVQQLRH